MLKFDDGNIGGKDRIISMKLIQIQYFLKVAECKSITKAAEQLFVSQPALSKQMNLLEEELGVELLTRTTSGIKLTKTGEEFAKDCQVVLEDLKKAITKAVNAGKKNPDALRIGCFDGAVTEDFLPRLYAYLRKTAPGLNIKLGRHTFRENREALMDDSIDMLIELRFPSDKQDAFHKECIVKSLAKRDGALIYSESSPLAQKKKLTLKDFEKETFIKLTEKENDILAENGLRTLKTLGLEKIKVEEVDNFATLISNVKLGLGFSPLSKLAVETVPGLRAFELPEELGLEVIAVWKKNNKFVSGLMKQYKS